jgi:N-acetylmuramoyl-L-alanine amidase
VTASMRRRLSALAALPALMTATLLLPAPRQLARALFTFDRIDWQGVAGFATCWPAGIVIHHTATPDTINGRTIDVALVDVLHRHRGFMTICDGHVYHVGYHYLILPNGTIQAGRPENCEGAHAGSRQINRAYLGVALVGDFDSSAAPARERQRPTLEQMKSLDTLVRTLMQRYQLQRSHVVSHSEISPGTKCPGDLFPMQQWRAQLPTSGTGSLGRRDAPIKAVLPHATRR